MYSYVIGKIVDISGNAIILDNNNIGYQIYTPNPFSFTEGESYKVYLYQQIKEDEHSLYGFKTEEEKEMFLKLIAVKGLGPKMALPILATASISGIIDAIERENILYLKKFPKIGDKLARQIILDLKGKLNAIPNTLPITENHLDEVHDALLGLGYKEKEIKTIISKIDANLTVEEQIKMALQLLMK